MMLSSKMTTLICIFHFHPFPNHLRISKTHPYFPWYLPPKPKRINPPPENPHVYAHYSVIKSNIPTSSNSNISSSTPLLQNHHQSQHLLAHQQNNKLTSGAHTTLTQSKDIIRTHEDYIRCKEGIEIYWKLADSSQVSTAIDINSHQQTSLDICGNQ